MSQALERTELPEQLVEWIRGGFPTRTDLNDPFAGRCGAKLEGARAGFCRLAAGRGTEHPGVGRCSLHPLDGRLGGLNPWVGTLSKDLWYELTGAREDFMPSHNATEIGTLSIEQIFARHMDQEDQSVLASAYTEPIQLIDFVLRLRQVALGRINREMHRVRIQSGGHVPASKTVAMESLANQITGIIARLLEAKGKFKELESGNETRSMLKDVLHGLSDEDFNALKTSPEALARILTTNPVF